MPDIQEARPARPAAGTRPAQGTRPAPALGARPTPVAKPRPDTRPLRIAYGMGALAAATALVTALISPPPSGATGQVTTTVTLPPDPPQAVRHVIQYIQLKPGQTAPPNTTVKVVPAPKPRVVVVTTRQSGAKP